MKTLVGSPSEGEKQLCELGRGDLFYWGSKLYEVAAPLRLDEPYMHVYNSDGNSEWVRSDLYVNIEHEQE